MNSSNWQAPNVSALLEEPSELEAIQFSMRVADLASFRVEAQVCAAVLLVRAVA